MKLLRSLPRSLSHLDKDAILDSWARLSLFADLRLSNKIDKSHKLIREKNKKVDFSQVQISISIL